MDLKMGRSGSPNRFLGLEVLSVDVDVCSIETYDE